jgi:hypothetical protein
MTLRTTESEFVELLLKQPNDEFPIDLTIDGPIMSQLHPRLIWAKLEFMRNPSLEPAEILVSGWNYHCFSHLQEAQETFPEIKHNITGRPWTIHQVLIEKIHSAIIDFPPLGTLVLSRDKLISKKKNEIAHHLLPIWANYALSPELWGEEGKWIRFHSRLQKLFTEYNLLQENASIGYYPLKCDGKIIEKNGFLGSYINDSFVLVLPWTFSLSALEKLEAIIRQEF